MGVLCIMYYVGWSISMQTKGFLVYLQWPIVAQATFMGEGKIRQGSWTQSEYACPIQHNRWWTAIYAWNANVQKLHKASWIFLQLMHTCIVVSYRFKLSRAQDFYCLNLTRWGATLNDAQFVVSVHINSTDNEGRRGWGGGKGLGTSLDQSTQQVCLPFHWSASVQIHYSKL